MIHLGGETITTLHEILSWQPSAGAIFVTLSGDDMNSEKPLLKLQVLPQPMPVFKLSPSGLATAIFADRYSQASSTAVADRKPKC
jgi:hypothetical protein